MLCGLSTEQNKRWGLDQCSIAPIKGDNIDVEVRLARWWEGNEKFTVYIKVGDSRFGAAWTEIELERVDNIRVDSEREAVPALQPEIVGERLRLHIPSQPKTPDMIKSEVSR